MMTQQMLIAANEYLKGKTKKHALLKAGYSKSVASTDQDSVFGREDVQEYIESKRVDMEKKTEVNLEWLIERLREIVESSPGDLLGEKGVPADLDKLDPELKSVLGEVSVTQASRGGKYKRKQTVTKARTITNADRIRAMEMMAKLLGLMQDRMKVDVEENVISLLRSGMNRTDGSND